MALNIEDYALIGDLRTGALVGVNGAIDWLCLPRFDSPAVCAALLGNRHNGRWLLAPAEQERASQRKYRPDTLVLETEWTTTGGAVRVTDFMVPGSEAPMVVRIVEGLDGEVAMRTHLAPRMGYGKDIPSLRCVLGRMVASACGSELWLAADVNLVQDDHAWAGEFRIAAGERISFTLVYSVSGGSPQLPNADVALAATVGFWTEWIERSTYAGGWLAEVRQSLIFLKALTCAPAGSIVAAATTSLPEELGGSRNWDYRYCWLRDSAFTLQAFLATGHLEEVEAWRDWLVRTANANATGMQVMYTIDGVCHLPEQTLDWLPGHAHSAPVRVGNAAAAQQQNDVWGEVLDILSAARQAGLPDSVDQPALESLLLNLIERQWQDPDHGLWEVRGPRRHFVHSKLLAWVGVDRAIRSLEMREPRDSDRLEHLRTLRRTIARQIDDRGFHSGRLAFTQSYGSARLDASLLLMPRYGFLRWSDPRMVDTVALIQRDLTDHGLVLRYAVNDGRCNADGVPGGEGTFLATSFWLADALHGVGRRHEAIQLFEHLLSLRNDVGLLSEEYDPRAARQLGNTPQALSHAGLIMSALTLSGSPTPGTGSSNEPPGRQGFLGGGKTRRSCPIGCRRRGARARPLKADPLNGWDCRPHSSPEAKRGICQFRDTVAGGAVPLGLGTMQCVGFSGSRRST